MTIVLGRRGVCARAGSFAGLTNIGGRGGPGGISRGKLVLDFILDPSLDLPDNMFLLLHRARMRSVITINAHGLHLCACVLCVREPDVSSWDSI
jgi:hypothetical protein